MTITVQENTLQPTSQAHSKSRKVPSTYVIHVRPYDCPSACIISVSSRSVFLKFYAGDFY